MVICRELSKFSKPVSIKSVNFRNTVPGSPDALLTPASSLSSYLPRNLLIDPTHPAAFLPRYAYKTFPSFRSNILGVQAYPQALLTRPEVEWPDPPFKRVRHLSWQEKVESNVVDGRSNGDDKDESGGNDSGDGHSMPMQSKAKSIDMAMLSVLGKKVHKKAVVRNRIITRLKTAISLIVVHGADAKDVNGESKLLFRSGEGKDWILPDWAYIFFPTIEIYRLPYPELVRTLRHALGMIYDSGLSLELSWREVAKESSTDMKRTVGVTRRYKQTHTPRPERSTLSSVKSRVALNAHETSKLTTSRNIPFGLRGPIPKPPWAESYPGGTDPISAGKSIKMDAVAELKKTTLAWKDANVDHVDSQLSPTSGKLANEPPDGALSFRRRQHLSEDLDNSLGNHNTFDMQTGTPSSISESPKPPTDTLSLFDDAPVKLPSLTTTLLKSRMASDTQGLDPERPWTAFDFGFDTVLGEERVINSSDKSTPLTTSSPRQISELPFNPATTPCRTTRPLAIRAANQTNIDKSRPDMENIRPDITLFQKKPVFIRPSYRTKKE